MREVQWMPPLLLPFEMASSTVFHSVLVSPHLVVGTAELGHNFYLLHLVPPERRLCVPLDIKSFGGVS
jgi:hypothetical protein